MRGVPAGGWGKVAWILLLGGCQGTPDETGGEIPASAAQIVEITGVEGTATKSSRNGARDAGVPGSPPLASRSSPSPGMSTVPVRPPPPKRETPASRAASPTDLAPGGSRLSPLGTLGIEEAKVQQLWEEGRSQELEAELSQRLQQKETPEVRFLHGKLALLQGREAEAAADFQKLAGEQPPHELGLAGLALLAEKKNKFEEARWRYQELIKRFPSRADYAVKLARTCEQLGRDEEAIRYYREGVDLNTSLSEPRHAIGRLALKLQKPEAGIEILENLSGKTLRSLWWLARLHRAVFERDRNLSNLHSALKYYEQFMEQAATGEEGVEEARTQLPRLRQAVVDYAQRTEDLPLEEKLERIKHSSPELKKTILASFSPRPPPAAVPVLLESLGDPSPEIRALVVRLLGVARPENLVSHLAYLYLLEENPEVKLVILETLGKLEELSGVPTLLVALKETDGKLVAGARTALDLVADKNGGRPREKIPDDSVALAAYWNHWWESVRRDEGEGGAAAP